MLNRYLSTALLAVTTVTTTIMVDVHSSYAQFRTRPPVESPQIPVNTPSQRGRRSNPQTTHVHPPYNHDSSQHNDNTSQQTQHDNRRNNSRNSQSGNEGQQQRNCIFNNVGNPTSSEECY